MDIDRSTAGDYVIRREGEALLAADRTGAMQRNPESANDVLRVDAAPSSSEFDGIYLDSYTADCAERIRDQTVQ